MFNIILVLYYFRVSLPSNEQFRCQCCLNIGDSNSVTTVPADVLAPNSARPSADTMKNLMWLFSGLWLLIWDLFSKTRPSFSKLPRELDSSLCTFNPICANVFRWKEKHIFTFYVIPPHWYEKGSWNPSSSKTKTCIFYIVNIMSADVLTTQEARSSATMIFTMLNQINLVPWMLRVKC